MTLRFCKPKFSTIQPDEIYQELENKLFANRRLIANLLTRKEFTWDNLVQPFEDMQVELNNFWSVISHLHAVVSTDELRSAYHTCLQLMTEYNTEIGINKDLYQAYKSIKQSAAFKNLSSAQKKVIDNAIRDFELAGVALAGQARGEYQQIQLKLSELSNQFQQNVMDATDSWFKLIEDETLLSGIPDHLKQALKQNAEKKQLTGWLLTLDYPTFFGILAYADNRQLRQEIYTVYFTRASDQSLNEQYDNSAIMFDILKYRDRKAKLLGFNNFGEYSLATKMANSTEEVISFLTGFAEKIKPATVSDWSALVDFAESNLQLKDMQPWDMAYASEKLRTHKYRLSQEELRPYFEINQVINGLFQIAEQLYRIKLIECNDEFDKWHDDISFYEIYNQDGQVVAGFYLDLYARPKKRAGAWMDVCRARHRNSAGELQLPIAFIVCNFSRPLKDQAALLTHEDVRTLFHEFGHCMHHTLTKVDIASVSGIQGVAWDAVEFPSQFMENWCWHQSSLNLIAYHHEDKTPLPDHLFQSLIASKNFQIGINTLRLLEWALFDFLIHTQFSGENQIQTILDGIRHRHGVVPVPAFHRFQHCLSHTFAGGYAAGLYSYKWAEVLACDAFSQFEQGDILDPVLGGKFRSCVLEKGGSEDAAELFLQFQGRPPDTQALLTAAGIFDTINLE